MVPSIDCLRCRVDRARMCVSGLITSQVTIEVVFWSGSQVGAGSRSVVSTLELPKYPIKEVSLKMLQASGGVFERGDVIFGPITPPYDCDGSTGGFSQEQLKPIRSFARPEPQREVIYRITGDLDGEYVFFDLNCSNPLGWFLTLRRSRRSPL